MALCPFPERSFIDEKRENKAGVYLQQVFAEAGCADQKRETYGENDEYGMHDLFGHRISIHV